MVLWIFLIGGFFIKIFGGIYEIILHSVYLVCQISFSILGEAKLTFWKSGQSETFCVRKSRDRF